MKLVSLTWHPYRIPLREPFVTAHGRICHRFGALIRVQTESGNLGNGEIAPLPEFNGIHLTQALKVLPELAGELCGRGVTDILRFLEVQSEDGELPAPLICGLEIALLDALGQARGQSLAALLTDDFLHRETSQTPKTLRLRVPVNAVISSASTETAVARAMVATSAGFTCLKLKVTEASQATIDRVAAIRAAVGPKPLLRLDANGGWSFAQARSMLFQCAPYHIQYVEQPLPAHDRAGMARLRRISPIPIAADEALSDLASARLILDTEAADVLILKPQLVGGLRVCRHIIHEAKQRQIDCVITSSLETGTGVTAVLHLAAASPEITLACGLATLHLLEDDLLLDPLTIRRGHIDVPQAPGLGIQVDLAMLKRHEKDYYAEFDFQFASGLAHPLR